MNIKKFDHKKRSSGLGSGLLFWNESLKFQVAMRSPQSGWFRANQLQAILHSRLFWKCLEKTRGILCELKMAARHRRQVFKNE
jgi:hypothetical protein